jgi:hypothetical protein
MPMEEFSTRPDGFVLFEESSLQNGLRRYRTHCGIILGGTLFRINDFDGRTVKSVDTRLASGFDNLCYPRDFQPSFESQTHDDFFKSLLELSKSRQPPEFEWHR